MTKLLACKPKPKLKKAEPRIHLKSVPMLIMASVASL
jgi:hypothetical protein